MGANFQFDRREQILTSELLDAVRKELSPDCIVTRCREEGCSVNIRSSPRPSILIDMNKALTNANETKCDFVFVGGSDESWVVPIELKSGKAESSEVVEQLEAGARFADRIIPKEVPVRFRLVVASRGIKRQQANELKRSKIKFRGKDVGVERIKCGGSLAAVLQ